MPTPEIRQGAWKYLGATFMEAKGPNGEQAVSYTRLLGVILYAACLTLWIASTVAPAKFGSVPEGMLYTLWGLIGIKGARDVAQHLRRS